MKNIPALLHFLKDILKDIKEAMPNGIHPWDSESAFDITSLLLVLGVIVLLVWMVIKLLAKKI
jgi:hypothetical protein